MWDYDKLFAENNVVGLRNKQENRIFPTTVEERKYWGQVGYVDWNQLLNKTLSTDSKGEHEDYSFEVMYIIRLDKHGNIAEKLFDRERDMPKPMPKLKTGMFVRVPNSGLGYVNVEDNCVIYQSGGFDDIDGCDGVHSDIVEVYKAFSFNHCDSDTLI